MASGATDAPRIFVVTARIEGDRCRKGEQGDLHRFAMGRISATPVARPSDRARARTARAS